MNRRILGVDPGEKRIGLAISDPTATIASPLQVIRHVSRAIDAAAIAQIARDHDCAVIVVGQALDSEGNIGPAARHAIRLAEAIRLQTQIPVEGWDESGSTQAARSAAITLDTRRRKRAGHLDDIAATVILQSYLDAKAQK